MTNKEITLKDYKSKADVKYKQFVKVKELIPDDGLIEDIDEEFLIMRMLKIFYNLEPKDTRSMKQSQVVMLVDKINKVLNQPISDLKRIIEVDGILYGLIPNFSEITVGELIDLDKQYEEKNFYNIASILYRPIVGTVTKLGDYQIEEYIGYSDIFEDISLDVVEGFLIFFIKSYHLLKQPTGVSMEGQR